MVRNRRSRSLELEAQSASTRMSWSAPATHITVAGLHGGAGATTVCLLAAHAIASYGYDPAVCVDLAGRARGGLGTLGGAAGEATVEAVAAAATVHGRGVARPFAANEAGVRVLGTTPNGVEALDTSHHTALAQIMAGVADAKTDEALADLARAVAAEERAWQALRYDNGEAAEAVGALLDQAAHHHALIATDLGMLDSTPLVKAAAKRSDLHLWVLPARNSSFEIAHRRLGDMAFNPAGREAIVVWGADGSSKRLSELGDLRGCPVVRLADHGGEANGWSTRLYRCMSGVTELCDLAR